MIKTAFQFRNRKKVLYLAPTRAIVLSFLLIIIFGAFFLNLPFASNDGKSIGFFGALFTSTSAACLTGMVVADTLTQWTLFGQIVIMLLIQVGGLGIITLTVFFFIMLGRKIGLKGMVLAQEWLNYTNFSSVLKIIKKVIIITFIAEAAGALVLSLRFFPQYGFRGIYLGIFHSISAFCNAGFDLIGGYKSFTEYNSDPIVLYTIAALVVMGGLGFIVWEDLLSYRKGKKLLLHTKIVLLITACLIILGALLFFSFEFNNPKTTGHMGIPEKINSAVFHSVSTRTSGFNSLPLNDMREISKAFTIFLMFIGAAPGSTAGGIKVTTLSVIIIAIISQVRNLPYPSAFKLRISYNIINKALAIIGLSAIWIVVVTAAVLAIEGERYSFINIFYEVTSAFSTAGFSVAGTPVLHTASKILLMITMFIGRVGPFTFALALSIKNSKRTDNVVFPEGKIIVG
jgi:trk system potassium uptake protein TrkH